MGNGGAKQDLPTVEWMKMQREMLITGATPAQM